MKYDYSSMREGSKALLDCLDSFVMEYKAIASKIDWEGDEKELFDKVSESFLANMYEEGANLSRKPRLLAAEMLKEDQKKVDSYSHV